MPLIVLWRLLRSRRCPRALNPETADLFLVPTWPGRSKQPWHPVCSQRANAEAMQTLAHLTETTAHRHFFLVGKGHVKPNKLCDAWWRTPAGLLRRAMRFAYSSGYAMVPGKNRTGYGPKRLDDDAVAAAMAADAASDDGDYPHLHSVPYASSIHGTHRRGTRPWDRADGAPSRYLAAYVGTPHADMPFAAARARLAAECAADGACGGMDVRAAKETVRAAPRHFCGLNASTRAATFCLEPGGDSPYRKGFYDAMLTGCVPVVFGLYNARVAPWFVPRNALVVVNETAYLGGAFNVLDLLRAVPPARVAAMRAALRDGAQRLQYAATDAPGDAFETLLRGAFDAAKTRHRDLGLPLV